MISRLLLALALAAPGFSEPIPVGRVPWRSLGLAEGMPTRTVLGLAQDGQGLLWVNTESKVFLFNGQRFLERAVPPPLTGPLDMLGLADGVWIGTRNGAFRLTAGGSAVPAQGLPATNTFCFARDARGGIWCLQPNKPFRMQKDGHFAPDPTWKARPQDWCHTLRVGPSSGRLILATLQRVFVKADPDAPWQEIPLPADMDGRLAGAAEDGTGRLWVRAQDRLWWRSGEGGPWMAVKPSYSLTQGLIQSLETDAQGWVQIPAQGGLLGLRGDAQIFQALDLPGLTRTFLDREGVRWLGHQKGLAQALGQDQWRIDATPEGLPADEIIQVDADTSGRPWIATVAGPAVLDRGHWHSLPEPGIYRLASLRDGRMIAAGRPGGRIWFLEVRDGLKVRTLDIPVLARVRGTASIAVDRQGRILALAEGGQLACGTPRGASWAWNRITPPPTLPENQVPRFLSTERGRVFLATAETLHEWRSSGNWEPVPFPAPVSAVCDGKEGELLAASGHPQRLWLQRDGEPPAAFPLPPIPTSPRIQEMKMDRSGHLWLAATSGLFEVDDHGQTRWYRAGEGLLSDDLGARSIVTTPGMLWVATASGLSRLTLPATGTPTLPPPVPLSTRAGNGAVLDGTKAMLPPWERTFDLNIALPAHARPRSLGFETLLEGVDANWRNLAEPRVQYFGLPSGSFRLRIRGRTEEGGLGPERILDLQVRPRWHETLWARVGFLVCGLGFFASGFLIWIQVLRARNRHLESMVAARTADLLRVSQAKSAFLAGMSHELRTPLNGILLTADLLQEEAEERGDTALEKDVDRVRQAGRHLLGLLNGVLDLAKIEAGKMEVVLAPTDPRELVHMAIRTLSPLATHQGNRIETHLPDHLPHLDLDATKVNQILLNLLSNACKFTRDGCIDIGLTWSRDHLHLTLSDTGEGMSPEQMRRVFHPYEQAERTTSHTHGGTGLGLSLARSLAEIMGGSLTAESSVGVGSTFHLEIPAKAADGMPGLEPGTT